MAGSRTLKLSILADVDDLKKKLDTGSKDVEGFGGKLEKFGKVAAAAFAAAAAAAAAYAVKIAVDGVKAAIEDEAAQLRLANALKNVTGATDDQIASVEKQIGKLSLATGIADDKLRPAFQRLATATGDITKAQDTLNLALDISAATGKDLDGVANALGKAYEGNTGALGRLGVGLSTAELKALGLDGTMKHLSETFGGAAQTQAATFEGRMQRLKVAFDEAKETIGTALLPILERLLQFVTDYILPVFQRFSDAINAKKDGLNSQLDEFVRVVKGFVVPIIEALRDAFNRVKQVIIDNKDTIMGWLDNYRDMYEWAAKYLLPFFKVVLVAAIEDASRKISLAIQIIVPVVKFVSDAIKFLINGVITQINTFIKAYNLINNLWGGKDVKTIDLIGETKSQADYNAMAGVPKAFAGSTTGSTGTGGTGSAAVAPVPVVTPTTSVAAAATTPVVAQLPTLGTSSLIGGRFTGPGLSLDPDMARPQVTVVVQAPSVIDQNGFTAAVVDAFNQVQARTGGGASRLVAV
jgi:hypothetical protein